MMEKIFNPNSIAIIGASSNPSKLGYQILKNIIDFGYKGNVYPVNIKKEDIEGMRVYQSILEIEYPIDMAIIVIPAQLIPDVLKECEKVKIKTAVIISAGFKEIGSNGAKFEEEITRIALHGNIRLIGPNSLGIISTKSSLDATFLSSQSFPTDGNIFLISQSGAIATSMLDWSKQNNLGLSRFISIGNKADINEIDLIKDAKKNEVIGLYLESISNGRELLYIGNKISVTNPVVVLKPGKFEQTNQAISSHTGALAIDSKVTSTLFKQAGFIEVEGMEGMFDLLKAFSLQPILKGPNIAIVTNTGGPAIITTDLLFNAGLKLAEFNTKTQKIIKDKLPREANIHDPINVVGDTLADRYAAGIDAALSDCGTDGLLVLLTPQITTQIERTAEYINRLASVNKKTLLVSFIGGSFSEKEIQILNKHKIPVYQFPERAVYTFSKMYEYTLSQHKGKAQIKDEIINEIKVESIEKVKNEIIKMEDHGIKVFDPFVSEKIIKEFGVKIPETYIPTNKEEAISIAKRISFPVTLKISSTFLLHKSDIGGVKLNINSVEELTAAYDELEKIIIHYSPEWNIDPKLNTSIILQKFIKDGEFAILGAKKHEGIGHILLFGMGGIYTEVFKDFSTRIAPIKYQQAEEMIKETKVYQILKGSRGQNERDIDSLIDTLLKLSSLVTNFLQISQVDINPLIVLDKGKGAYAVDTKIIIE